MAVFAQKETVIFVGGRGTKAGDSNAGGGCTKTFWGDLKNPSKALSDVMGTNGEPISSASAWNGSKTACDLAEGGSYKQRIIKAGSGYFSNCQPGLVANVDSLNDNFPDGRYEVLAVDPSGHWIDIDVAYVETGSSVCDVKVGGAFPTQQEASDETDAGDYTVNILTNKNVDLSAAIDVDTGGGDAYTKNSWKRIIGIDDNGVERVAGSYTEVGDNGNDINCYQIGDVDNIEFRHIYAFSDTGSPAKRGWKDTGTVIHYGIKFVDCKSEYHEYSIEMLSKKRHIQILGGYYKNVTRVLYLNACYGVTVRGATLENSSAFACIQEYNYIAQLVVDRCVLKKTGSGPGIYLSGYGLIRVTNCVFYNVGYGIGLNYQNNELVEYNNIYYLSSQTEKAINRIAGSIMHSDYSCLWTMVGAPTGSDRWGGMGKPEHAIEENPLFVDASGSDFRPRNPNVLRGGLPDIDDNPSQMGVILQKYQFARRARGANVGRLQIIR